MLFFRIIQLEKRETDLLGTGACNEGGHCNNKGVFALYTNEHPGDAGNSGTRNSGTNYHVMYLS